VFNLDELGFADWEDRHVTLLTCVSAARDTLTPFVIMASPIPDTLWSCGSRQDEDAMIRQRSPADVTEELFYDYISTIFIPYVMAVRDRTGFQNETVVLLMDSAIPHTPRAFGGY
jgi:hypothetical protein